MKKRIIAILLAVVLVFGAVVMISGCDKDEDTGATPNESTDVNNNTEESTDESSTEEKEDVSSEKETENKVENDTENKTEAETDATETTPSEPESSEKNDEFSKCKTCGKEILPDSYSGGLVVGEYCDGKCDEWLGELEL